MIAKFQNVHGKFTFAVNMQQCLAYMVFDRDDDADGDDVHDASMMARALGLPRTTRVGMFAVFPNAHGRFTFAVNMQPQLASMGFQSDDDGDGDDVHDVCMMAMTMATMMTMETVTCVRNTRDGGSGAHGVSGVDGHDDK